MYPELFHIGPIPIRSYGVMLAIAFFAGVIYLWLIAKRDKKPFEPYLAVAYISIFGGVIGGRLAYVLFHLDEFSGHWSATFNPFADGQFGIAGMNLYGGVLLAIIGTIVYCFWKKIPLLEILDYFAPAYALGLAFGRIGCFLNGCCFGTPSDLPWAVVFPTGSIPYSVFGSAHLHPSQLYTSFYGLALFFLTHYILKHRRIPGVVASVLFMTAAVFRVLIESVRYYEEAMYFTVAGARITYNHAIAAALFLFGLGILVVQLRKRRTSPVD